MLLRYLYHGTVQIFPAFAVHGTSTTVRTPAQIRPRPRLRSATVSTLLAQIWPTRASVANDWRASMMHFLPCFSVSCIMYCRNISRFWGGTDCDVLRRHRFTPFFTGSGYWYRFDLALVQWKFKMHHGTDFAHALPPPWLLHLVAPAREWLFREKKTGAGSSAMSTIFVKSILVLCVVLRGHSGQRLAHNGQVCSASAH